MKTLSYDRWAGRTETGTNRILRSGQSVDREREIAVTDQWWTNLKREGI